MSDEELLNYGIELSHKDYLEDEFYDYLDLANYAIESEIEKQALYNGSYRCPVCLKKISELQKYCHNCGQKIGWEEYEEEC